MIKVLDGQYFVSPAEFTKALNTERLANKQKWITYIGTVNNKRVELKSYDTGYLQILRVDGTEHGAPMDMKVGAWKAYIEKALM